MRKMLKTSKRVEYLQIKDVRCFCCGTCSSFIPPNSCSIVKGKISSGACCNRWSLRNIGSKCY